MHHRGLHRPGDNGARKRRAVAFFTLATLILQEMTAGLGAAGRRGLGPALRIMVRTPLLCGSLLALVVVGIGEGNVAFQTGNVPGAPGAVTDLSGTVPFVGAPVIGGLTCALLRPGMSYVMKHTTNRAPGVVTDVRYRMNVNTLHREDADGLALNEIGRCTFALDKLLAFDPYTKNRAYGSFIVIDRLTNNTVGAGMMIDRRAEPEFRPGEEPPPPRDATAPDHVRK